MAAMFVITLWLMMDSEVVVQLISINTSTKKHAVHNVTNETLDYIRRRSDSDGEASTGNAGRPGPDETSQGDDAAGPSTFRDTPTIVIQLNGEMGNHLSKFAFGYIVKWILEDDYNITSSIVLRHQDNPKWVRARKSMMCFTKIRTMAFSKGNTQEFEDRREQQRKWLGSDRYILETAISLRQALKEQIMVFTNTSNPPPILPDDVNITIPFIYADSFALNSDVIDPYFDRLKDLFEYDLNNPECCGPRALPNESVFHARGFAVEVPKIAKKRGYEEVSPNKTVTEILWNHQRGDKIAVLSRFASFGQPYVDRMLSEGLDARLVETSNGEQSFCFLMSGQNEIIGAMKSTFMRWASYLGNASKARIYTLRSPHIKANAALMPLQPSSNFTNPALSGKTFLWESYNSDDQDQIDQGRPQKLQN